MRRLYLLTLLLLLPSGAEARRFADAIGDVDRGILEDLERGRIVESYPYGDEQGPGRPWKVRIEHNGRTRWALFKPRVYAERPGEDRVPMEVAVYRLNRILGMDMVPPAAYRRLVWVGGNYFAEGAFIHWAEDGRRAVDLGPEEWRPGRREAFASDLRLLQVLARDAASQNGDRIMRARHWKDGRYRVCKVNNAGCGAADATVSLEEQHPEWGAVTRFNRDTYDRLRELSFDELRADLGGFVSDDELRRMLTARDGLVRDIEQRERAAQARGGSVWLGHDELDFDARRRLGKDARPDQLRRFMSLMSKSGIAVQLLPASSALLRGAAGRTVLDGERILVRLAASRTGAPNAAALVEELVHVRQLQTMARKAGGLQALYASLKGGGRSARAIRLSMEEYAKGKVALVLRGVDREKAKAEQVKLHVRAVRAARTSDTRTLWRSAP